MLYCLAIGGENAKSGVSKGISTKSKKRLIKSSKFYQNGSFDFWTSCPQINCNPLPCL